MKADEVGLEQSQTSQNENEDAVDNPSEAPTQNVEVKSVFVYENYRSYIRDTYLAKKANDKNFSYRNIARMAGFKSSSFLKLVMDGKSNLSPESIEKVSKVFKHNKAEAQYFRLLVLLNQSTTAEDRRRYSTEILKLRAYRRVHPLDDALHRYISRWYFIVIKEMVALPGFREDPEWIAEELGGQITPHEAKRAIDEMLEIGIIGRDDEGKLYQIKSFLMTPNEVVAGAAAEYHREMAKKAAESIDRVPRSERELSALTIGVSRESALKIKEMVQEFREKIMEVCTQDSCPDSVYQVNLHLFPLVRPENKEA
jgi:uncharacterized protein (TIGR02147 family)